MFSYQVPKILRMLPTRLLGPFVSKYQWFVYLGPPHTHFNFEYQMQNYT